MTIAPEFIHPSHPIHDEMPSGFTLAEPIQVREYERTGFVNGAAKVCFVRDSEQVRQEANTLQAAGPDEFPRGYYDRLAAERVPTHLALRLRPPRSLGDIVSELGRASVSVAAHSLLTRAQQDAARDDYIRQYNLGYSAGKRGNSERWDSGTTRHCWDDGYLDGRAERAKWHLTYCADHDSCGEA